MPTITPPKTETDVLLVDDNPADSDLTREILGKCKPHLRISSVDDGVEGLSFLHRDPKYAGSATPDLLVLDLNLPRKGGHAVLKELKSDPKLSKIPVIIFTTSEAHSDITGSYELGANCYLRKPGNLADYVAAVEAIAHFWLGYASLPQGEKR